MANARSAARRHRDALLAMPGVNMVASGTKVTDGVDTGEPSVVVGVPRKLDVRQLAASEVVPQSLAGLGGFGSVPTDVVETGPIRALASFLVRDPQNARRLQGAGAYHPNAIADRWKRWRPLVGGVSIGHPNITAGTLGLTFDDGARVLLLSNNHVLANSNAAKAGDQILQPGPHDGGGPNDAIGRLLRFVPIAMDGAPPGPEGCKVALATVRALNFLCRSIRSKSLYSVAEQAAENRVDAALAEVGVVLTELERLRVLNEDESSTVRVGGLASASDPDVSEMVAKSGRTTGYTSGPVRYVDAAVRVSYGEQGNATFVGQCVVEQAGFSAGGDSGSAIFSLEDRRVVGLLFAGSESHTIFNPISAVRAALGI